MASSCDSSEEDLAKFAVITDVVDSGMMKKLIYLQEEMEFCLLIRSWSFFPEVAMVHSTSPSNSKSKPSLRSVLSLVHLQAT